MRTLRKNQKKMKYALQIGEAQIYKTDSAGNILYDSYTDDEGNVFPYLDEYGNKIPLTTGETEILYSKPREFMASVSMSGGEAEAVEYGLSTSDYQATLLAPLHSYPIVEGALIWTKSEVKYKYNEEVQVETDKGIVKGRFPIKTSADYSVIKLSESLNFVKYILKATTK